MKRVRAAERRSDALRILIVDDDEDELGRTASELAQRWKAAPAEFAGYVPAIELTDHAAWAASQLMADPDREQARWDIIFSDIFMPRWRKPRADSDDLSVATDRLGLHVFHRHATNVLGAPTERDGGLRILAALKSGPAWLQDKTKLVMVSREMSQAGAREAIARGLRGAESFADFFVKAQWSQPAEAARKAGLLPPAIFIGELLHAIRRLRAVRWNHPLGLSGSTGPSLPHLRRLLTDWMENRRGGIALLIAEEGEPVREIAAGTLAIREGAAPAAFATQMNIATLLPQLAAGREPRSLVIPSPMTWTVEMQIALLDGLRSLAESAGSAVMLTAAKHDFDQHREHIHWPLWQFLREGPGLNRFCIPLLRERLDDIEGLAQACLQQSPGGRKERLDPSAIAWLRSYQHLTTTRLCDLLRQAAVQGDLSAAALRDLAAQLWQDVDPPRPNTADRPPMVAARDGPPWDFHFDDAKREVSCNGVPILDADGSALQYNCYRVLQFLVTDPLKVPGKVSEAAGRLDLKTETYASARSKLAKFMVRSGLKEFSRRLAQGGGRYQQGRLTNYEGVKVEGAEAPPGKG